ncbi:hypothetical protein KSP39_PZI002072 [Platanthera zijinensis]|uniref:Uncharacterized protein n=1 Tax=Platanthera zijinensis TaxID=2320716 RepID=A0AAP0BCV1_9ASPA
MKLLPASDNEKLMCNVTPNTTLEIYKNVGDGSLKLFPGFSVTLVSASTVYTTIYIYACPEAPLRRILHRHHCSSLLSILISSKNKKEIKIMNFPLTFKATNTSILVRRMMKFPNNKY